VSPLHLAIKPASFFWTLESVSSDLRLPFSCALLKRRYPPPYDVLSMKAAIQALGAEVELVKASLQELESGACSWFALIDDSARPSPSEANGLPAAEAGTAPRECRVARICAADSDGVTMLHDGCPTEARLSTGEFALLYRGVALQARQADRADHADTDPDMPSSGFGFRWFAREMLRHRKVWRDVLLASLAIQLLALLVPLLTQTVIDKVITHRTSSTLIVVSAALVLVAAFSAVLSWIRQYYVLHAGTRIDAVLGNEVFEHLLRLPARYFERRSTGVLVARLQGIETIREFLAGASIALVLDLPFMAVFVVVMLYYSPLLTAISLGVLALLIVVSLAVTPLLRRRIDQHFLAGARHQAFVTERLAAIETVKSLQLEPVLSRRFDALFSEALAAGFRTRQVANSLNVSVQFLEQILALSILCAGAWLVVDGAGFTVGALIAFQMFAARLTAPVLRIAGLWQEFQQVHIAVRRLADIMDVPKEPWRAHPVRASSGEGRLRCAGLGFRYGDGPWVVRNLSFEIHPGRCVALIGASGTGKSTLARLLQGFYLPLEGRIEIDGIDITGMAANELRSHFGVVPQETRLFSGSLLDNLMEAEPSASFADVVRACEFARLHEVIESMPEGYLTRIGENGAGLSGGQKQRLAIARALLKRPRILVFDEATSSLDPTLADEMIETANRLHGAIAVLFIGHRLPERLRCDSVIRLDMPGGRQ